MAMEGHPVTAEELERMADEDARIELVKGEVVRMAPAGHYHGSLALNLGSLLNTYVRPRRLGRVYGADTGFILSRNPDTVRAPDVAFVRQERVAQQTRREGFFDGAPDLAVEVLSPDDTYVDVEAKVKEYLDAGTKMVWVLNPRTTILAAYRSLRDVRRYTIEDTLDGGDVLPGLSIPMQEIFD